MVTVVMASVLLCLHTNVPGTAVGAAAIPRAVVEMVTGLCAALDGAECVALAGAVTPAAAVCRAAISRTVVQVTAGLRAAFNSAEGTGQAGAVTDCSGVIRAAVRLAVVKMPSCDGAVFDGAELICKRLLYGCLLLNGLALYVCLLLGCCAALTESVVTAVC